VTFRPFPIPKTFSIVTVAGMLTITPCIEAVREVVLAKHYHTESVGYTQNAETTHYTVSGYDSNGFSGQYVYGYLMTHT
jgi:hypothetical protein